MIEEDLIITEELRIEKVVESQIKQKSKEVPLNPLAKDENDKSRLWSTSDNKTKNNQNVKIDAKRTNPKLSSARKVCNNCNSTSHLTHACKMSKVDTSALSILNSVNMNDVNFPCGKDGCMLCAMNMMFACFTCWMHLFLHHLLWMWICMYPLW